MSCEADLERDQNKGSRRQHAGVPCVSAWIERCAMPWPIDDCVLRRCRLAGLTRPRSTCLPGHSSRVRPFGRPRPADISAIDVPLVKPASVRGLARWLDTREAEAVVRCSPWWPGSSRSLRIHRGAGRERKPAFPLSAAVRFPNAATGAIASCGAALGVLRRRARGIGLRHADGLGDVLHGADSFGLRLRGLASREHATGHLAVIGNVRSMSLRRWWRDASRSHDRSGGPAAR